MDTRIAEATRQPRIQLRMPPKMIWIEKPGHVGWGCSECAWIFQAPAVPIGKSLEEILRIIELQRDSEFASHRCAQHPKSKS